MLTAQQQELLTRIGPDTPMGDLFRRYWMPVLPSCDLEVGSVKRVRILGEDLVVFRDRTGTLGALEEHCPHRGTSLGYGCVEEEGIRCPYHGWKFNAYGDCLDMPVESQNIKLRKTVSARSYPVEDLGGLVFLYLGPKPVPLLPKFDVYVWENVLRDIGYALLPCNWLQIMENSVDPHHVEWLHGHHLAHVRAKHGLTTPTFYRKRQIKIDFEVFKFGIIKRRILEGGSETDDDWSIGHPLIFPNMLRVGSHRQHRMQIRVPVDDTHTLHFWYSCYRPAQGTPIPQQTSIPSYQVPWQDDKGQFILDFVDGGDIMSWVTQGPIADRTRETLVSSDQGIALYRRLLLEQMKKIQDGQDPLGVIRNNQENEIIELPQENEKFGQGALFLAESMEMGHARYSPIKDLVQQLL